MLSLDFSDQNGSKNVTGRKQNSQLYLNALKRHRELRDVAVKRTAAAVRLQTFFRAYKDLQKEKVKRFESLESLNDVHLLRNFLFLFLSIKNQQVYNSMVYGTSTSYGLSLFSSLFLFFSFDTSPSSGNSLDSFLSHPDDVKNSQTPTNNTNLKRRSKYLEYIRCQDEHLELGRQFFSTNPSTLHHPHYRGAGGKSYFAVADAASRLSFSEYQWRFPALKDPQRTFFVSVILPKAFLLLSHQQLSTALGYKIMFVAFLHCPCVLQRWGIEASFPWDTSLTAQVCVALIQQSPSGTAKMLVHFDILPLFIRHGYFTLDQLRTMLKALEDISCIWQSRVVISLCCSLLYHSAPFYHKLKHEIDECLLRFFSDSPQRFTKHFHEYFLNFISVKHGLCPHQKTSTETVSCTSSVVSMESLSLDEVSNVEIFTRMEKKPYFTGFTKSLKQQLSAFQSFHNFLLASRHARGTKRLVLDQHVTLKNDALYVSTILTEAMGCPGPLALQQFLLLYNGCLTDPLHCVKDLIEFFSHHVLHTMEVLDGGFFFFLYSLFQLCYTTINRSPNMMNQAKVLFQELTTQRFLDRLSQSSLFFPEIELISYEKFRSFFCSERKFSFALKCLCRLYFPLEYKGWSKFLFEEHDMKFTFYLKDLPERSNRKIKDPQENYSKIQQNEFQTREEQEEGDTEEENELIVEKTHEDRRNVFLDDYLKQVCSKPDLFYFSHVVKSLSRSDGFFYGLLYLFQYEILKRMKPQTTFNVLDVDDLRKLFTLECLYLCVAIGALLEARLRSAVSATTLPFPGFVLHQETLMNSFLDFSTLVFLLNRLTSVLIQDVFKLTCSKTDEGIKKQKSAILLAFILRDLHRLRRDLFTEDMWMTSTRLLKSTQELMDQAEKFRSRQYSFGFAEGLLDNHESLPSNVTLQGTKDSFYALAMLITRLPHSISFHDRSLILTLLITDDKLRHFGSLCDNPFLIRHEAQFRIRRTHLIMDTLMALQEHPVSWRRPIAVTFIDYFGNQEKGVDGGGLFREYLTLLSRALFSPSFGLFEPLPDRTLVPCSTANTTHGDVTKTLFQLAGTLVGKAIYEHILLEPVLNRIFLNKVQNVEFSHLEDLRFLDPELYKHLKDLDSYTDLENLQLTFSATLNRGEKCVEEVDLIPHGKQIPVTRDNVEVYRRAIASFHLNLKFSTEANMFREGLNSVIPLEWLKFFEGSECSNLISGKEQHVDVNDLAAHVDYSGGFTSTSPTVQYLWTLLKTMPIKRQRQFLMFVTGCSRPPFLGFRMLQPRFKIQLVDDTDLLPSASTCVNQLNLPAYETSALLKEKLDAALDMAQGFELY